MKPTPQSAPVAKRPRWKSHMAILAVVNVLFLIGIFALTQQLDKSGQELKKLRTEKLVQESHATDEVAEQELATAREQYRVIAEAFPDEDQLLEFVTSLDDLKRQGLIRVFSFASDTPLKDKNGIYGLPILIELAGSGEQISEGLRSLEALPFILNSVKVEVATSEDGSKTLRYGGFLYVDQEFSKN